VAAAGGPSYYQWSIRSNTTTNMTGTKSTGRAPQVAELQARIDTLLRAQGYTKGTVGDRLNVLNKESRFVFPNTDPGRAQLLEYLNELVRDITPRCPARSIPCRVPRWTSGGCRSTSRQGARRLLSGRVAGWLAPRRLLHQPQGHGRVAETCLPTLTYHEAVPGHHFQITGRPRSRRAAAVRRTQGFAAYNEGWALYSERVADELGVYENDPFGGSAICKATCSRCASGSRQRPSPEEMEPRAGDPLHDRKQRPPRRIGGARDRTLLGLAGQALAYKLGQTVIERLRAEQEQRPGFDLKRSTMSC
jgi:uncharacterized protein (DUF885 family)